MYAKIKFYTSTNKSYTKNCALVKCTARGGKSTGDTCSNIERNKCTFTKKKDWKNKVLKKIVVYLSYYEKSDWAKAYHTNYYKNGFKTKHRHLKCFYTYYENWFEKNDYRCETVG